MYILFFCTRKSFKVCTFFTIHLFFFKSNYYIILIIILTWLPFSTLAAWSGWILFHKYAYVTKVSFQCLLKFVCRLIWFEFEYSLSFVLAFGLNTTISSRPCSAEILFQPRGNCCCHCRRCDAGHRWNWFLLLRRPHYCHLLLRTFRCPCCCCCCRCCCRCCYCRCPRNLVRSDHRPHCRQCRSSWAWL